MQVYNMCLELSSSCPAASLPDWEAKLSYHTLIVFWVIYFNCFLPDLWLVLKPVKMLSCGDSENQVKLPSESPKWSWELNADKSWVGS